MAKGYFGAKSTRFRMAKQAVMKSLNYAYIGRKLKKRDFRKLWIARINAAARMNGLSYSKLMNGLKKAVKALIIRITIIISGAKARANALRTTGSRSLRAAHGNTSPPAMNIIFTFSPKSSPILIWTTRRSAKKSRA